MTGVKRGFDGRVVRRCEPRFLGLHLFAMGFLHRVQTLSMHNLIPGLDSVRNYFSLVHVVLSRSGYYLFLNMLFFYGLSSSLF